VEFKRNIQYFMGNMVLSLVGAGVGLVGLIFTFLLGPQAFRRGGGSMFIVVLPLAILIAGIIMLIIDSGRKSKEADIQQTIDNKIRDLEQKNTEKMNPATEKKSKTPPPERLTAYPAVVLQCDDFTGDEPRYVKRKSDGKYRSSIYSAASIIYTKEKLFILKRRFSLTEDLYTETFSGTPYQDITYCAVEEVKCKATARDGDKEITSNVLVIKKGDEDLLRMSVPVDSNVDKTVESVNRLAEQKRKALEAKEQ
jgi:hypothetical protein